MTAISREASCTCGALALRCDDEPARVSVCHCHACQRRTGSAFGAQARFARNRVTLARGVPSRFERVGDSGGRIAQYFCPSCGSTVYWEIAAMPDWTIVALGAFADPSLPAPTYSVYEARKHAWVAIPGDGVEHVE